MLIASISASGPTTREYIKYTQNHQRRAIVDFSGGIAIIGIQNQDSPRTNLTKAPRVLERHRTLEVALRLRVITNHFCYVLAFFHL